MAVSVVIGVVIRVVIVVVRGILQIIFPPEQLKVLGILDLEAVIAPKGTRVLAVILVAAAPAAGRSIVGPEPLEVDLGVHDAPDLVLFGTQGRVEVVFEEPVHHLSPDDVKVVQV